MDIWLLQRKGDDLGFDENDGFVIAARSPSGARRLAAAEARDEGPTTWYRPEYSTCTRIGTTNYKIQIEQVILRSFNAG